MHANNWTNSVTFVNLATHKLVPGLVLAQLRRAVPCILTAPCSQREAALPTSYMGKLPADKLYDTCGDPLSLPAPTALRSVPMQSCNARR